MLEKIFERLKSDLMIKLSNKICTPNEIPSIIIHYWFSVLYSNPLEMLSCVCTRNFIAISYYDKFNKRYNYWNANCILIYYIF